MLRIALVLAITCGLFIVPAGAEEKEVRVYNWSDYIDPTVLADFTKKTGIKVIYDVYDSNDILETKLFAGKTGYDIVVPTNTYLARQIQAGVLGKLDKAMIPNLSHMDPEQVMRMQKYDPGNQYGVIYLWGTSGIGYNVDLIKARMSNAPVNSLAMIFDPAVVAKFADCGVTMLDAPDEMIPAALRYLGEDPDSKDPKILEKAEAQFLKIRPYIRKFHSSQYINDLANGDSCLALGWSGDIQQAKTRAEEAKNKVKIRYVIPREGALQWFDNLAIPADAPNRANAHMLINYLMDPKVIAKISSTVQYPNANKDALRFVSREAQADENFFPKADTIKTLYTITPNTQPQQRIFTRIWTKIKGAS